MTAQTMTLPEVGHLAARIRGQVAKAVVGQTETVDALLTALVSVVIAWACLLRISREAGDPAAPSDDTT